MPVLTGDSPIQLLHEDETAVISLTKQQRATNCQFNGLLVKVFPVYIFFKRN